MRVSPNAALSRLASLGTLSRKRERGKQSARLVRSSYFFTRARRALAHLDDVHLRAVRHHHVARLLIRLARAGPFGLDRHVGLGRHAGDRRAALALRIHLHGVARIEIAGDDRARGRGRAADIAHRVDRDGVARTLHVLLRALLGAHAAADIVHRLVGRGIDAVLEGLHRHAAAFHAHLQLPQPGLARRHVEGEAPVSRRGSAGKEQRQAHESLPNLLAFGSRESHMAASGRNEGSARPLPPARFDAMIAI